MLLFIILALLVILAKSLFPPFVIGDGFSFDVAVAIAGLLSYVALLGFIFGPRGTAGNGSDSRRAAPDAEGNCETTDRLQQDVAARPIAGSSLVRRLVLARADAAKQRIRAQLSEMNDERLFGIGLTSEDIAALRDSVRPPAEVTVVSDISPPIAAPMDATDGIRQHETDASRRERVSGMPRA